MLRINEKVQKITYWQFYQRCAMVWISFTSFFPKKQNKLNFSLILAHLWLDTILIRYRTINCILLVLMTLEKLCSHQFVIFPRKIEKLSQYFFFFHIENLFLCRYYIVHAISVPSTRNFCDTYIFSLTSRRSFADLKNVKLCLSKHIWSALRLKYMTSWF